MFSDLLINCEKDALQMLEDGSIAKMAQLSDLEIKMLKLTKLLNTVKEQLSTGDFVNDISVVTGVRNEIIITTVHGQLR